MQKQTQKMNFKSEIKKNELFHSMHTWYIHVLYLFIKKLCISKWNYGLSAINQFNSVHLAYNGLDMSNEHCIFVALVNSFTHNFANIIDTYTVLSKNYRIRMRCSKITLIGHIVFIAYNSSIFFFVVHTLFGHRCCCCCYWCCCFFPVYIYTYTHIFFLLFNR